MQNEKTRVVKSHDVVIDSDYAQWLTDLKARYRSAQIKAAVRVNFEQLHFNWLLGRDLVIRKAEEKWGTGVVEQLSLDLQAAFPESKGFSTTNLWYMKQWYEFYSSESTWQKLQQLVGEMQSVESQTGIILQQYVGEVDFPIILGLVPWGHHIQIISNCKFINELKARIRLLEDELQKKQ